MKRHDEIVMKPIGAFRLLLAISVLLSGCVEDKSSAVNSAKPEAARQVPSTASSIPTRLSLSEATAIVRQELFRSTPDMNPSADFPLKELTTTDVWDRLHAQVFTVTSGVREDQAFVIRDQQVFPLGVGFGGDGVMSMCVAILNGDGQPKLVFSYSWGSGIHRSLVGIWTRGSAWIDANPALKDYDLFLEKIDDQHVDVSYSGLSLKDGLQRQGEFGTLRLSTRNNKPDLEIVLNPHLAADILSRVWK